MSTDITAAEKQALQKLLPLGLLYCKTPEACPLPELRSLIKAEPAEEGDEQNEHDDEDNADNADNLLIADSGAITVRTRCST